MGLRNLGCDVFSGTTQGWVYPLIVHQYLGSQALTQKMPK